MKEFLLIPVDFVARIGVEGMARTPTFLARFSHDSVRPRSYEKHCTNTKIKSCIEVRENIHNQVCYMFILLGHVISVFC